MIRVRVTLQGEVQGVGFRPRVVRLAAAAELSGWVANAADGVVIELQGLASPVHDAVAAALKAPAPATVRGHQLTAVPIVAGETGFCIAPSSLEAGTNPPSVPPDLATCPTCMAELSDPQSHFFGHPFVSCTACGPRWTIVGSLPFDRERSAMAIFPLCPACQQAYSSPSDRRYHAQAFACPAHAPTVRLGTLSGADALDAAATSIASGEVVALKGLGGFQLLADANSASAVERLRRVKNRPDKPLALMWPTSEAIQRDFHVSPQELAALTSLAAPIVLLRPRRPGLTTDAVSRGIRRLGVMLPTTGLHHLLLHRLEGPVVCTSGNVSGDPIATAPEALQMLTDRVVDHDRPVLQPVDDSVVRLVSDTPILLRRARGYAPRVLPLPVDGPPLLAVGPHMKATVALASGHQAWVSAHLGDLETRATLAHHERACAHILELQGLAKADLVCDAHPDYPSTRLAEQLSERWGTRLLRVQHHHAHVAAVVGEHEVEGPVLGLAWDGTGFGTNGSTWGGEALVHHGGTFERVAHLRPFRLPGGDAAARDPIRAAAGLLAQCDLDLCDLELRDPKGRALLAMVESGIHAPWCTSIGRLFDGVAALAGFSARCTFEAQAAMALEQAAEQGLQANTAPPYPFVGGDWRPMIGAIVDDRRSGAAAPLIAARFHLALAAWAAEIAEAHPNVPIALAGGCFQNAVLLQLTQQRLAHRQLLLARELPPGDGAISFGQLVVARYLGFGGH